MTGLDALNWLQTALAGAWYLLLGGIVLLLIWRAIVGVFRRKPQSFGQFFDSHLWRAWRRRERLEIQVMEEAGHPIWKPKKTDQA